MAVTLPFLSNTTDMLGSAINSKRRFKDYLFFPYFSLSLILPVIGSGFTPKIVAKTSLLLDAA